MAEHREYVLASAGMVPIHLRWLIEEYEAQLPKLREVAKRLGETEFEKIDGKSLQAALLGLIQITTDGIAALKPIQIEIWHRTEAQEMPSRETITVMLAQIGRIAGAANAFGAAHASSRLWRWDADFKPMKFAMEPLGDSKVDEILEDLARYLKVIA